MSRYDELSNYVGGATAWLGILLPVWPLFLQSLMTDAFGGLLVMQMESADQVISPCSRLATAIHDAAFKQHARDPCLVVT